MKTRKSYIFDVSASDSRFKVTTTANMTITGLIKEAPTFDIPETFYVWSGTQNNKFGCVQARYPFKLTYFITTPQKYLSMDHATGCIMFDQNLLQSGNLTIAVAAVAQNGKLSETLVTTVIKPYSGRANLNFTISFSIPVDLSPDTCFFDLLAEIPELPEQALTFQIRSEGATMFYLDGTNLCYSSLVKLAKSLRTTRVYIDVTENDFPINVGTIIVLLQFGTQNIYAPLFGQTSYNFNLRKPTSPGLVIGRIKAIDGDRGGNPYGLARVLNKN